MRGPAWARLGTQCWRCAGRCRPARAGRRSASCTPPTGPPPSGRSSSVRGEPSETMATTVSARCVRSDRRARPRSRCRRGRGWPRSTRSATAVVPAQATGPPVEQPRSALVPRPGGEAGDLDDAVVHRPLLVRSPRGRVEDGVEEGVGPRDPAGTWSTHAPWPRNRRRTPSSSGSKPGSSATASSDGCQVTRVDRAGPRRHPRRTGVRWQARATRLGDGLEHREPRRPAGREDRGEHPERAPRPP